MLFPDEKEIFDQQQKLTQNDMMQTDITESHCVSHL